MVRFGTTGRRQDMSSEQIVKEDRIAGDRRNDRRYAIRLDLRWKLIRRRRVLDSGTGQSVDLSSGGILIETDRPLPVGLNIELSVAWPVMLHDTAPMQLVISGRIARSAGRLAGIRMMQHEFRTAGVSAEQRASNLVPRAPLPMLVKPGMMFKASR